VRSLAHGVQFGLGPLIEPGRQYVGVFDDPQIPPLIAAIPKNHPGDQALDPQVAACEQNVLRRVVTGGTGTAANLGTWPTAGKTGTGQDNKAVWFSGFTEQETTAVWVGFPGNQDSLTNYFGQSVFGGTVCAPIWHAYMLTVMAGMPALGFPAPPPVTTTPSPPASKPVPNVMGKPLGEATAILNQAGFQTSVTMVSDAARKGTVVGQTPAPGADGIPGTAVALRVSTGVVRIVKVPLVVGMTQNDAVSTLQQRRSVTVPG
jgi:membrane peptidoglycan carboxypeptidase